MSEVKAEIARDSSVALAQVLSPIVLAHLSKAESTYLVEVFNRYHGYPTLQQLWRLMDVAWKHHRCDPMQIDQRFQAYYSDPVWILNGLFIEQHAQSLAYRRAFTEWVKAKQALRIADYGGGFGGLARMIGAAMPRSLVEVVEPYPHPAAVALAATTTNVRFVSELKGDYDLLIATDVFEHVQDPISLAAATASHLRPGGSYLIANCFMPVIKCHLPQLFHLHIGWGYVMRAMGLEPKEKIQYGRVYQRLGRLNLGAAHRAGRLSKRIHVFIFWLPKGRLLLGHLAMRLLSMALGI